MERSRRDFREYKSRIREKREGEIVTDISFASIFRPDPEIKREFRVVLTFTTDHFSNAVEFCEALFDRMFESKPKFKFERRNNVTTLFVERDLRRK